MTIVPQNNPNQSNPFDIICRIDENGMEYWSARELMPILGYPRWHDFEDTIKRAMAACENASNPVREHFSGLTLKNKTKGRPQQDYHLTRYACYLVAMNGDPRKPEIASAQTYFAVKTREAEVLIPAQQNELEVLRLKLELAQAERDAAIAQTKLLETRKMITEMANPTVSALILGATVVTEPVTVERVIDRHSGRTYDGIGITAIAQKLGFGKNTKACWMWLDSIGYGKDSGHWELQLSAVENHKLKPSAFHQILRKYRNSDRQKWLGEL